MSGAPSDPATAVVDDLLRAAIELLAAQGISGVTASAVGERSGYGADAVDDHFQSEHELLVATAVQLSADSVVGEPERQATSPSVGATVATILDAHRRSVELHPIRFQALLQLAAGAFGDRELTAPLTARHRRTLAETRTHLALAHRARQTTVATADLTAIAETLVGSANGIEMCHLLDRDDALRSRAYDALQSTLVTRLTGAAPHGADRAVIVRQSVKSMTFEPGYRLTLVLEPSGVIRDVIHMSGIDQWDSRLFMGRSLVELAEESERGPHRSPSWKRRIDVAHLDVAPTVYEDQRAGADRPTTFVEQSIVTPVLAADGTLESILVDLQDLSKIRQAQAARRELHEHLSSAVELAGLGRYTAYIREPRMDTNARFRSIYGLDPQTLMEDEGFEGFFGVIHAEDRPGVRAALAAAMTGEHDYIANYRLWAKRPDGPELRWIEALGRVDFDDQGPLRVVGVIEDVTDRRKYQEAQLRLQKREAVGTLVAGIAHDFNNALGAVLANAEQAAREVDADDPAARSIAEIRRGASRAAELVGRLLSSTRDEAPTQKPFDAVAVIAEACALIRPAIGAGVDLRETAGDAVPSGVGDAGQLHQVMINLIANASHAIGNTHGLIQVDVDAVTLTADGRDPDVVGLPNGTYLRVSVRDDGPGIPEHVKGRIFDPFFTTKPIGLGTGLGLASAQSIVTNHGGSITVASERGEGTTFTILWPTEPVTRRSDTSLEPRPVDELAGETLRVLIVDDEQPLTDLARRAMPAFGCIATVFNDPLEALAAFIESPDAFDAVVTDLAMPTADGMEVTRRVHELRPQLPVVLTSGYLAPEAQAEARRLHVAQFVQKPWSISGLSSTLHELVDAGRR